jgi:2-polyprenyl-3-methyl-5-hydroxy-6-metoxy-1,4-benzoquinol methylase
VIETGVYHYHEDVNWGLLRLWNKRKGLDVLDVGCGIATTSQYIERMGNRVVGIDANSDAVVGARQRISRVLQHDVQEVDAITRELGGLRFDVIIFADMLEHLPWPGSVLQQYLPLLKEGGSVFVSLPNFGLWSVRFAHLFGRFEYQETGVLDRTHLRFFTRSSAARMLEESGLRIVDRTYNPGLVRPFVPVAKKLFGGDDDPAALMQSPAYKLYLNLVHPIERVVARLWPGMLAFQMVFEAKRE